MKKLTTVPCCWIILGLSWLMLTINTPSTGEEPAAPKWKSLFDGKELGGWEETKFASTGGVEVRDGQIVLHVGDGCTGVTWKKEMPKVDYEVRLEAQRIDGSDFFCGLTFPVKDKPLSLIVGGWGGTVVGLSSLDGADAAHNDTMQLISFKTKQWYRIRLRVIGSRVQAWIDDDLVVNLPLRKRELSVRAEVELSRPLGICSWNTTAGLRKIEIRELTKEEVKATAESPETVEKK